MRTNSISRLVRAHARDLWAAERALAAQGMQPREDSRSEAEAEGLQPGPAKQDAPDYCLRPTSVTVSKEE